MLSLYEIEEGSYESYIMKCLCRIAKDTDWNMGIDASDEEYQRPTLHRNGVTMNFNTYNRGLDYLVVWPNNIADVCVEISENATWLLIADVIEALYKDYFRACSDPSASQP